MPTTNAPVAASQVVLIGGGSIEQSRYQASSTYVFDTVMKGRISKSSTVTKHPTANNEYISDHVFQSNDKIAFDIVVTDYPIEAKPDSGFAGTSEVTETSKGTEMYYSVGRAWGAYQILDQLKKDATLVTIVSGFQSFYNCVLTDFGVSEDNWNHTLTASLVFEQLRLVTTRDKTATTQSVSKGTARKEEASNVTKFVPTFLKTSGFIN